MTTILKAEFAGKDQNWQDAATTYWFRLSGIENGTEFGGELYGLVESADDYDKYVDCDGAPLDGLFLFIQVRAAIDAHMTDELRAA